ncbi:MAG: hypothetical protein WC606_04690 [Candidatus Absconditabacterales bacterium]|jgi:hypothetical protein
MGKITLEPGKEFGGIIIPKNVFIEIDEFQNHEKEMHVFWILKILINEVNKPKINCSCENSDFLWLLESHQRGKQIDEKKAFVSKIQITCKRCHRSKSLDVGPTIACYESIRRNPTIGLRQWAEEMSKSFNEHFKKNHSR